MSPASPAEVSRLILEFRKGDGSALARLAPLVSPTAEHWDRIGLLFDASVGLDSAGRAAFLDRECAGNPTLRAEVDSLLRAADEAGDFIGASIARAASDFQPPSAFIGRTLGAWRLISAIGEGGMGAVYLAERADAQYRAHAAVKLLRGGLASLELERRFRAERQILSDLVHPNIARLLDGGTAPDGTPYLILEYIDGQPLDSWCATVGTGERIRLFMKVCTAVQHAHRALVIHRDIKPSNILVGRDGEPKLLDFGIAKLLESEPDDAGVTTALRIMTPSHASPEQIRGDRITTASDVYSLGVVLYQILSGTLPIDPAGLSFAEIERRACEEEPPRPSTRAPVELRHTLAGDLDNIVLKALRKEPSRRYGSPAELANDLQRYLERKPVSARPDTVAYRSGKFIRRHPIGLSATAAIALLLVTLATTSVLQARRLERERDRAEAGRLTAERVSDFLTGLFTVVDPNVADSDTVTLRTVLDEGSTRALAGLGQEPDVRATLAATMGRVYRNLGLYEPARALTDSALAIRRALHAPGDLEIASALHEKAELLYTEGAYDSAVVAHREALTIQRARLGPQHEDIATSINGLAAALDELGELEESERLYREALAMNRSLFGPEHGLVATSLANLAGVLRSQGRYDEAITLLEDALPIGRRVHGSDHLEVAAILNQLSRTYSLATRNAEALPLVGEAVDIQQRAHGGPHPETAASLGNLAGILAALGRLEEAEAARRESLAMLRAVFPGDHPYVAATLSSLGELLLRRADLAGAVATLRESVAMHRRILPAGHPGIAHALTPLGNALVERGQPSAAEPLLREAYDLRREGLPAGHRLTATSAGALGACLTRLARYAEAEPLLRGSLDAMVESFGTDAPRSRTARERLAELYDGWARPADAARVRAGG